MRPLRVSSSTFYILKHKKYSPYATIAIVTDWLIDANLRTAAIIFGTLVDAAFVCRLIPTVRAVHLLVAHFSLRYAHAAAIELKA